MTRRFGFTFLPSRLHSAANSDPCSISLLESNEARKFRHRKFKMTSIWLDVRREFIIKTCEIFFDQNRETLGQIIARPNEAFDFFPPLHRLSVDLA